MLHPPACTSSNPPPRDGRAPTACWLAARSPTSLAPSHPPPTLLCAHSSEDSPEALPGVPCMPGLNPFFFSSGRGRV